MRQHKYDLDEEKLRPYFALPNVMDGLFKLIERLFDVKVEKAPFTPPLWHESVMFYQVSDTKTGEPKAYFYLDPYTRPAEKRGGAWMDAIVDRYLFHFSNLLTQITLDPPYFTFQTLTNAKIM